MQKAGIEGIPRSCRIDHIHLVPDQSHSRPGAGVRGSFDECQFNPAGFEIGVEALRQWIQAQAGEEGSRSA